MKKEAGLIIEALLITLIWFNLANNIISVAAQPGSLEAYFIGWFAVIYWGGLIIIFISGWRAYCKEVDKQQEERTA